MIVSTKQKRVKKGYYKYYEPSNEMLFELGELNLTIAFV